MGATIQLHHSKFQVKGLSLYLKQSELNTLLPNRLNVIDELKVSNIYVVGKKHTIQFVFSRKCDPNMLEFAPVTLEIKECHGYRIYIQMGQ